MFACLQPPTCFTFVPPYRWKPSRDFDGFRLREISHTSPSHQSGQALDNYGARKPERKIGGRWLRYMHGAPDT